MAERRRSAPVIWAPYFARSANAAALAGAAAVLIMDEALDHPTSGEDYGPGALVGVRIWVKVHAAAVILSAMHCVVLVLPVGLATPTVNTIASLKQNEKYVWAILPLEEANVANHFEGKLHLNTVRRFDPGDRLCLVLVNIGAVAFGAAAEETVIMDAYVRED